MENGKNILGSAAGVETVWIVQKLDWVYNDEWHVLQDDIPVKAFTDRAHAQKYCDLLTAQEQDSLVTGLTVDAPRGTSVTTHFGGPARMTTLSDKEFARRVNEQNLPARRFYEDVYSLSWWRRIWETLSPERRAWLWSLFDLIQFYEVVEVELLP